MSATAEDARRIVDYDGQGYDYRGFWADRDYERWAEAKVLSRLFRRLSDSGWFADFGGGFGRNAPHYLTPGRHGILVDYSVTNLTRAAELWSTEIEQGRLHLIRADLEALPLLDGAVEQAMVVRVLHHLTEAEAALREMCRTVSRQFLIDVPIKHHLLGWVRAARTRTLGQMRSPEPRLTGETDFPFRTYRLPVIRSAVEAEGWETELVASVNNLRRWDRVVPAAAVAPLRPAVYSVEWIAQRAGRGWWGPSQLLLARRRHLPRRSLAPVPPDLPAALAGLAQRTRCPRCHGGLEWEADAIRCSGCERTYPRRPEGYWDFVVA